MCVRRGRTPGFCDFFIVTSQVEINFSPSKKIIHHTSRNVVSHFHYFQSYTANPTCFFFFLKPSHNLVNCGMIGHPKTVFVSTLLATLSPTLFYISTRQSNRTQPNTTATRPHKPLTSHNFTHLGQLLGRIGQLRLQTFLSFL